MAFWHEDAPLQAMVHSFVLLPQLTLPGQLLPPVQRSPQLSASQRTSLMHAPCLLQPTSQALPRQLMLPAQALSASHATLQVSAPAQSTPLEQELGSVQLTLHGTPSGQTTFSLHG
jgi:hypothetical protein